MARDRFESLRRIKGPRLLLAVGVVVASAFVLSRVLAGTAEARVCERAGGQWSAETRRCEPPERCVAGGGSFVRRGSRYLCVVMERGPTCLRSTDCASGAECVQTVGPDGALPGLTCEVPCGARDTCPVQTSCIRSPDLAPRWADGREAGACRRVLD